MFQDGNAVTMWTGNECQFTNIGSKEEKTGSCRWDIPDPYVTFPLSVFFLLFNPISF